MNIDRSGDQGFMSEDCFDGQQIGTVFVKMSAQSMAERMAGESFRSAQTFFMPVDMS